jgi:16S rRNA C967 or C1407 C5-methylase (RsmB/RsmF family)
MHEQQRRILSALWPLLAPGGRLVYITCSVLRAENEAIVGELLAARPMRKRVAFTLPAGHAARSAGRFCRVTAISMACITPCCRSGLCP